jgi:hypothetical protein
MAMANLSLERCGNMMVGWGGSREGAQGVAIPPYKAPRITHTADLCQPSCSRHGVSVVIVLCVGTAHLPGPPTPPKAECYSSSSSSSSTTGAFH